MSDEPTSAGDGGAGGQGSAGGGPGEETPDPALGEPVSSDFACKGWTDIEAAMIGHVPDRLWLTRLDMRLPLSALGQDCFLVSSEKDDNVEPLILAGRGVNSSCPEGTVRRANMLPAGLPAWLFAVFVCAAWMARRKLREEELS